MTPPLEPDVGGDDVDAIVQPDGPINHGDSDRRAFVQSSPGHVGLHRRREPRRPPHGRAKFASGRRTGRLQASTVPSGRAAKASLVRGKDGELTSPASVSTRPAASSAATRALKFGSPAAIRRWRQSFGSRLQPSASARRSGSVPLSARGPCATTGRQYTGQDNHTAKGHRAFHLHFSI